MKNLKKTAAVLTAAAMMSMSMGMIAYAANSTITNPGSDSQTVTGNYVNGGSAAKVYKVDIHWDNMEFTYTAAGSWDADTHSYSGATNGNWSSESNTITLKNHSNAEVTAALSFEGATGFTGVTAAFTDADTNNALPENKLMLDSADKEEYRIPVDSNDPDKGYNAPTKSVKMTLSGAPADSFSNGTTIGTVTVSIQ